MYTGAKPWQQRCWSTRVSPAAGSAAAARPPSAAAWSKTALLRKRERSRLLLGTTSKVQNPARFGLGSGCCPLGGVVGSVAVLSQAEGSDAASSVSTGRSFFSLGSPCACFSSCRAGPLCTFPDSSWTVCNSRVSKRCSLMMFLLSQMLCSVPMTQDAVCCWQQHEVQQSHKEG